MTLMIRFLLVLSVFFVVGCATVQVGREFDPTVFQSFEVGKTTTTAVLQAVGEPWLRQTMPDGLEVWTYLSSRSQAFAVPLPFYTQVQTTGTTVSVTVIFRDGVLTRSATPHVPGLR